MYVCMYVRMCDTTSDFVKRKKKLWKWLIIYICVMYNVYEVVYVKCFHERAKILFDSCISMLDGVSDRGMHTSVYNCI